MISIAELTVLTVEELEEECVWINHRDAPDDVVKCLSDCVGRVDECKPLWKGDVLWVKYQNEEYELPLEGSSTDCYSLIHSVASIWDGLYEVRILRSTLDSDTHAFLILSCAMWQKIDLKCAIWSTDFFEKLKPGWDYFNKTQVPIIAFE